MTAALKQSGAPNRIIGGVAVPQRVIVVMDMVANAARRGDECPSNAVLATGAGCSKDAAIEALKLLEALNIFSVERGRNWRVVTIVSSGESTAAHGIRRKVARAPNANRTGPSQAIREASAGVRAANRRKRIALFCDALAEGSTIKDAGRAAGVSEVSAHAMMRTVKAELGAQAQ